MYQENKETVSHDKDCEFGVFGEVLKTLQREESEQNITCPVESPEAGTMQDIPGASVTQKTMELIKEINVTLKEIAETQKRILEEIKKNRTG